MTQNLTVVPHGLIEEGEINIHADPKTGIIDFEETIVAGVGPFTQTDSHRGELKIDPKLLLSENIRPGLTLQIGPVKLVVLTSRNQLSVHVDDETMKLDGNAILDLSGEFVAFENVILSGTVEGHAVTIELKAS